MISFDAADICNWANNPDAFHKFPELVRRLVMATVPMQSLLRIPSGSSVWRAGWDGLLVVDDGNVDKVPSGASAWEFGTGKNPKRKATEDYRKRTENTLEIDRTAATFVFATPRSWPDKDKEQWVESRRQSGQWTNVRVLDADDLVTLLEQAPSVAHWFARICGKLPEAGVVPLDEWWESWSVIASPNISPELVSAGRQEQVERVSHWLQGEPSHFYVQGNSRDEAIAFLASCANADEPWGSLILTRAIVVEDADAWRSLERHSTPLVLVRAFSGGNVAPQIAVGRGHHVLTALGEHEEPAGNGITLPLLGRDETAAALEAMGLSQVRARSLAWSTARRLPIIHRQLVDEAGGSKPEWASSSSTRSLARLVLIGQWDGEHEGDKAIVAEITGQPYELVERDVVDLMNAADSPVTRIGTRWRFTSHQEAWHLLAPRLTPSDVERFERVAISVFGAVSPEFELLIEERYMASLQGKVLPHSGTLRDGLARSLALIGTHPDRARNVNVIQNVPTRVVSQALAQDKGWQIWATLSGSLSTLAEASPEAVLDAIERDLNSKPSPFEALFAEEGDGFLGGTPHTGLLWALERLAWSQDYFARVAKMLARLAEIDPGGRVSNRPAASLHSLFIPFIRFTEASDEHRLDTLEMLLDASPLAGWQALVGAYPSRSRGVVIRQPSSWRPWAQDGVQEPTVEDYHVFVDEIERLLIENVGSDAKRWSGLVGILSDLSAEGWQQATELLTRHADALGEHTDAYELWAKLREELHRHNSYPEASWAMDVDDVVALEAIYRNLTPADPVTAHAWLFDNWPHLPEGNPRDHIEASERIAEAQQTAIRMVFKSGGTPATLRIAEAAIEPQLVGEAVALGIGQELGLPIALEQLDSTDQKLRLMALGCIRPLYSLSGWKVLDEAIVRAKANGSSPEALAYIYLAAPTTREAWKRLNDENEQVRTFYWKSVGWLTTGEWNEDDYQHAVQQLISVRRSVDIVNLLWHRPLSHEIVIQILEAIPLDVTALPDLAKRLDAHTIADFFKKLDQSDDVPEHVIARLEIPYVGMLRFTRSHLALHRQVTKDASVFADFIAWAFKRADDQVEEYIDDQVLESGAELAWHVLWQVRLLPGVMEDGSVDAEALSIWINEARRLCLERGRQEIGDVQIGQLLANAPVGEDGIWPCEPVRDLLDQLSSSDIGDGFTTGKTNLSGVTTRGAFEGGGQENTIAEEYRRDAAKIAAKWPFTAHLVRQLATSFEADARLFDHRADWSDQFWL